jgi:hypothetical protein
MFTNFFADFLNNDLVFDVIENDIIIREIIEKLISSFVMFLFFRSFLIDSSQTYS